MHKTAILVPSLGRAEHVKQAVENIDAKTPEDHIQLWCVTGIDYRHWLLGLGFDEVNEAGLILDADHLFFDDGPNNEDDDYRYVTRMNKLVSGVQQYGCDTVFFGSDDVVHHEGWLSKALKQMDETDKAVVVVNDLHNAAGTQALVKADYLREGKAVYDGDTAFHPGYLHNYADNEMFFTAMLQNELTRAKDSLVEHLHPVFRAPNSREWDETYRSAAAGWEQDTKLWRKRQSAIAEHFS